MKPYTNHCIRSTVISNLLDAGYQASDICAVTGHKCEDTVRKYGSQKRLPQLEKYSNQLNASFHQSTSSSIIKMNPDVPEKIPRKEADLTALFGQGNIIHIGSVNVYHNK